MGRRLRMVVVSRARSREPLGWIARSFALDVPASSACT